MTLIDRIEEAMLSDDEDRAKQSSLLLDTYQNASPQVQAVINECLIYICGWSIESLLQQVRDSGGNNG